MTVQLSRKRLFSGIEKTTPTPEKLDNPVVKNAGYWYNDISFEPAQKVWRWKKAVREQFTKAELLELYLALHQ